MSVIAVGFVGGICSRSGDEAGSALFADGALDAGEGGLGGRGGDGYFWY